MDTITVDDMLIHYELKLKEVDDGLDRTEQLLNQSLSLIESGWKGDAANICTIKLEEILSDIKKASGNLSEAIVGLDDLTNHLSETATLI